ncbi:hypothetical protein PENTCL1PPCAC_10203, partial [Pristionchus entomophagus]
LILTQTASYINRVLLLFHEATILVQSHDSSSVFFQLLINVSYQMHALPVAKCSSSLINEIREYFVNSESAEVEHVAAHSFRDPRLIL